MASLTTKAVEKIVRAGLPGMTNDGDGLYLRVGPTGCASWLFRYKLSGKSRYMGLGRHPETSLAVAREKAADARRLSRSGVDPIASRDEKLERKRLEKETRSLSEDKAPTKQITFKEVALDYIAAHKAGWKNAKHAQQWKNTLTTYAFKVIGDLPTQEIGIEHVLKILKPIWTEKPETASRLRNRIELVLDAAKARDLRVGENPARWRGHLDKLLPPRQKVRAVKHHAAIPWTDLPAFVATLEKAEDLSSKAVNFTILTACRTSEVLLATWAEVDLVAGIWTIPASRMKAGKEHRVPLSKAALDLLIGLPRVEGNNHLFPGARKGRPLSNMAMLMVLRRMKRNDLTTHGFRSTFRDWVSEVTHYPREVCEQALAHTVENAVEAAYRRGDLFEKRRRLMDDWAGYAKGIQIKSR
ncbi:tyrosine-type recombinase/integrase [Pseudomonas sp. P105]|uniref:tyrosine-type recombinase/integrase n=1 Tax=Pseudomonas sp. P105 TaxID=3049542 RepID=UPI0029343D84|nr:integrase arm-type DNA-binding domain-containing protein [Pseudomonas sp. P105]WNZ80835.1 integrase arm-type DNA-binding domain-containing protein [Pseudomonas sp. P105]